MHDQKQIYSLRKLSVGLASVIVGTCFFISNGQQVKADTVNVGEQQTSTVIQQDNSKKQEQDSNEQNDQTNVSNSKTEQQQSTNERNDVENVDSNLNDTDKLDNATKPVESEANQRFDQVKDQFKQETSVKQTPVKEQPVVSNKDANINLNSNLNKNANKQTLANSLLKDTTKPETTTLNVIKASQAPITENMLKEDKTEVKENEDWADPAKQGYQKTTAGWTKLQQGKDYNAIATQSNVKMINTSTNKEVSTNISADPKYRDWRATSLDVTIDKDDLKKDNKILLGTIIELKNSPIDSGWVSWTGSGGLGTTTVTDQNGTTIGYIAEEYHNLERDYFLRVVNNNNFARDISFTYKINNDFIANPVQYGYQSFNGITKDSNAKTIFKTNSNTYQMNYNVGNVQQPTPYDFPKSDSNESSIDFQGASWVNDKNGYYGLDNQDHHIQRVFKITPSSVNGSNFKYTGMNELDNHPPIYVFDKNNKVIAQTNNYKSLYFSATAKNMSAQMLFNSTPNHSMKYSVQDDGSIICCYKVSQSDFAYKPSDIESAIKQTYWWNVVNPSNKEELLQHTLDVYASQKNRPLAMDLDMHMSSDNWMTPAMATLTDVTPNTSQHKKTLTSTNVPNGSLSIDVSVYRQINVNFVDDDDNGKTINTDVKVEPTGTDSTFSLDKDKKDNINISVPDNVILSDSQPDLTKFNYDPTTKTFHYGVVKDTNPDIVIHVKHKIVKEVSGDDKTLDNYPNIKKSLNGEIKLVANYTYPDNGKFTDEKAYPKQKVFSLTLKRSADVDLTTDSIVSGTAGAWSAVNQNGITFNNGLVSSRSNFGETLPEGYTLQNSSDTTTNAFDTDAFQTSARNAFASLHNAGGPVTKVFNYVIKADPQKIQVKFVDDDDPNKAQVDDIITVNGVTDGQADLKDVISAYKQDQAKHYDLTGDTDPNKLTHIFSANDSTTYTIHLKHHINDVKAENTEDATRTIVINKYDGHGNLASTQTVVQQIAFYKHDYVDAVTNKVKSSKYIFDDKSSPALSHNVIDGKATNDPSYVLQNGKYYFAKYKLDVPAGYKAEEKKLNPNMMMISLFAFPTTLTDPNTSQTDTNKKPDTSSSSVIIKPSDSKASHDNSKKQNDQPIISNNETDHTINVSAQAVDPTVEPEAKQVRRSNNSTTSAQTQQSSTTNAEQPTNISNTDHVVNDQNDDNFTDPSREDNDGQGSKSTSNWSKPVSSKITQVDNKTSQRGLNEAPKAQSVATHPATSVIKPSKSVSNNSQLPQTGENNGYQYSVLGLLLGLNVAIAAVGAEKKRKKY